MQTIVQEYLSCIEQMSIMERRGGRWRRIRESGEEGKERGGAASKVRPPSWAPGSEMSENDNSPRICFNLGLGNPLTGSTKDMHTLLLTFPGPSHHHLNLIEVFASPGGSNSSSSSDFLLFHIRMDVGGSAMAVSNGPPRKGNPCHHNLEILEALFMVLLPPGAN